MIRWVLLLMLLAGPALAISDPAEVLRDPAQEARAEQIGSKLRCMVCQNESIEDSGADLARDLRGIVRQRVAAGDNDDKVVAWMVARYGDFVRLSPPLNALTFLLWFSPVVALAAGALVVFRTARNRSSAPAPLTDAERIRLVELGQ